MRNEKDRERERVESTTDSYLRLNDRLEGLNGIAILGDDLPVPLVVVPAHHALVGSHTMRPHHSSVVSQAAPVRHLAGVVVIGGSNALHEPGSITVFCSTGLPLASTRCV